MNWLKRADSGAAASSLFHNNFTRRLGHMLPILCLLLWLTGPELATAQTACSPLQPGSVYWGADGHRDQGGVYTSIPLSQQISNLQAIFGTAPNTIFYRALGDSMATGFGSDVVTLQAAGIIPIVMLVTYPNWTSFANQTAAYNWAYASVTASVQSAPTNEFWEIGNEWDLQQPISGQYSGNGTTAADWESAASFPLYLGVAAGAIAAIRANAPSARIIGGANSGWTNEGFEVALENNLQSYNGVNLTWDITVDHWYNDAYSSGNTMGIPSDFNGGMDVYTMLNAAQKPIFFTEFGSSDNNNSRLESAAGKDLTQLMTNFLAYTNATSTTPGFVGGTVYQLYQQPGVQTDYFLYSVSSSRSGTKVTLSPQGQAVKNWIASYGNPSGNTSGLCAISN